MPKQRDTKKREVPRGKKIPSAWSLSAYDQWRSCAAKYYFARVLKLPTPKNRAMERGIEIHSIAEGFLKGSVTGMPNQLASFSKEFKQIKAHGAVAEADWTLTADLKRTVATDWDNAWLRSKIDAHLIVDDIMVIIDFKTGQVKPYEAQKNIYAWIASEIFPEINEFHVELWFLDHGESDTGQYLRSELQNKSRPMWLDRAKRMLADRAFPANPSSSACKWCPFRSDKGGPCHAWKRA